MRLIGWLSVVGAGLSMILGVLIGRENMRVYRELCARGPATGRALIGRERRAC
jgi:hypothetical protein